MTVIARLRTPNAILIVLCSALLAQLPHAADVFRLIVLGDGIWATLHSYTYAVALELAVLLFVVQHRNIESYAFAVVSICVNLSYYALHGVQLFSVAALPAWLISIALPAAIAQYSHLIAAASDAPAAQPAAPADDTPPAKHSTETPDEIGDIIPATPAQHAAQPETPRSSADIARELQVSRQTVDGWKRRGTLETNIARRLPTVAAPHQNGNGGTHE